MTFSDRLFESTNLLGHPLCVGIDPRFESLPDSICHSLSEITPNTIASAYETFCTEVLDIIHPYVRVIKFQMAFFEILGGPGFSALQKLLQKSRQMGFLTILDGKRNDISSTATAYAQAAFSNLVFRGDQYPIWKADAMTINPYLGSDTIETFAEIAKQEHAGLFVLVRTSNPGSGEFQNLICNGKPLFQYVVESIERINSTFMGDCGFGNIGAVVGATHPEELIKIRQLFPKLWLLIPGVGAQGGDETAIRSILYRTGPMGAIVNSSRGITFCYHSKDPNWKNLIRESTLKTIASLKP